MKNNIIDWACYWIVFSLLWILKRHWMRKSAGEEPYKTVNEAYLFLLPFRIDVIYPTYCKGVFKEWKIKNKKER